jgi:hypothetical protein
MFRELHGPVKRTGISGIWSLGIDLYIGRVALSKQSFVAHTSVTVLLEMKRKYAGIYSNIFAIRCFEYSTARMECFFPPVETYTALTLFQSGEATLGVGY